MTASALLQRGPEHLTEMLTGITAWLNEEEYSSVQQLKGSMSQQSCPDPAAFERASYMQALISFSRPIS